MTESQYYYYKNKSLGLCVNCGRTPAAPERTRCEKCLAKRAAQSRRYRAEHKHKQEEIKHEQH